MMLSGRMGMFAGDDRQTVEDTWCSMLEVVGVLLPTSKWVLVEHMIVDIRKLA